MDLLRHSGDRASFLIRRDEQRNIIPVHGPQVSDQLSYLGAGVHVAAKEDDAAGLDGLDGIGGVLSRLSAFNARQQELAYLLSSGQLIQLLLNGVGRRCGTGRRPGGGRRPGRRGLGRGNGGRGGGKRLIGSGGATGQRQGEDQQKGGQAFHGNSFFRVGILGRVVQGWKRSVDRYRSPVSGRSVTMLLP